MHLRHWVQCAWLSQQRSFLFLQFDLSFHNYFAPMLCSIHLYFQRTKNIPVYSFIPYSLDNPSNLESFMFFSSRRWEWEVFVNFCRTICLNFYFFVFLIFSSSNFIPSTSKSSLIWFDISRHLLQETSFEYCKLSN